jgi:hypothetical protein
MSPDLKEIDRDLSRAVGGWRRLEREVPGVARCQCDIRESLVVEMAGSWMELGGDSNTFWQVITGDGPG